MTMSSFTPGAPYSPTGIFVAMHSSIALGITAGLLASFVQSLGLTIQRKSHVLNQRLPEHEQRVEHRRPLWLLGFGIFISSNIIGSLVQIASLPVVILAPLGAVSLIWNAFFARFLLGDVFSAWMLLGTFLVTGGAVLIAWFGIVPEPTRSLEDLLELFRRPVFVVYFSLLGVVVVVALLITHVAEYSLKRRLTAQPTLPISLPHTSTALSSSAPGAVHDIVVTERTPLIDRKSPSPSPSPSPSVFFSGIHDSPAVQQTRLLLALSYSSFSGIISGMCLLFAKSGVELLLLTLRGQNQFWRWESWMLLVALAVFALLQLWYLHKALTLANPTLVCPSAFCFYNLSAIVNGLVYFDQFALIPPLHLILVVVGFVTLLGGVWVVSVQPGEYGVDVGSWAEGTPAAAFDGESEESDIEEPVEDAVREISPEREQMDVVEDNVRWRERLKRRESRSESNIIRAIYTSPERIGSILGLGHPSTHQPSTPPATISHAERSRSTSLSVIQSPRRRFGMWRRRRPTLDGHPYFAQAQTLAESLARPLTGQQSRPHSQVSVAAIGPGFHIGLSPLSPGFSLLPRRRRISGLGLRNAITGDHDEGDDGTRSESARRRTLSEGDLGRQARIVDEDGMQGDGDTDVVEDDTDDVGPGKGKGKKSKSRWGWLKKLTRRK